MNIRERAVQIPLIPDSWDKGFTRYFRDEINKHIQPEEVLIRFIVAKTDNEFYYCELQIADGTGIPYEKNPLNVIHEGVKDESSFNVVLNIPTGVNAEIGGESGDATPVARMIAQECDNLILHPNVVNASDINEMAPNTWYVEGSQISKFMMGQAGLRKPRSNKILIVADDTEFTDYVINAAGAARASFGAEVEVLKVKDLYRSEIKYSPSGRPTGEVLNLHQLINALRDYNGHWDALAVSSYVHAKKGLSMEYFLNDIVNPWGGIEAMITHGIASHIDRPLAHAPMIEDLDAISETLPVVHPSKAAEAGSVTFLHCVLKGLHKAPRLVGRGDMNRPDVLSAKNISALIIPDGCFGQTVTAAIDQGIPVIAVKNKNIMQNDLTKLPFYPGQLIQVDNYLEACGVLSAMKAGVSLESVRRPLEYTKVTEA